MTAPSELAAASVRAFAALKPDDILAPLEDLGFRSDGRFLALGSYENRVYRVGLEDGERIVAKFYRPGRWSDAAILEEHGFTAELAAREIPVVPPLVRDGRTLHHSGPFRFAVFPCSGGRAPELDAPGVRRQLGRLVARIHLAGELSRFAHRPAIDIETYGRESQRFLVDSGFIPPDLVDPYNGVAAHLLANVAGCFERAGPVRPLRLHGDLHAGNVLSDGEAFFIVDFDDVRTGPAVQDLWMFLSGDREEQTPQLASLLDGYEEFRRFDARELHLIEALRSLRIMHYAAWIARRWEDPAFQRAFPWFGTPRYWDEHVLTLREQAALTQEPPLAWTT
ncbi:MAG TPA: serine/threonine protein kinase [Woeseiaceae bacterium]|nr:serine/threonine protein kinase [Woeseiaceae bacterium]